MGEGRSERADTMLGAVLGSYRITGVLAAGGMGTVFKGKHDVLDRHVAIKLLRRELTGNDEIVQRFWSEARAATAIKHPGIIEVVDFGYSPEGRAYLVMELLDGESLAARLSRGPLSESDAIHITRSIANALVAAHAKAIVHRDLKPDNIFLVPDAQGAAGVRTKILDFGIAKLQDGNSQTQTGALIGTPLYMAPEQARSAREIDHRADLYSLGCILYEMLAGRPPFVAPGAGELIAMHMFNDVPPLRESVAVTPELDSIVMRLLEKEPDARFQSAQALIDAFVALRASGQVAPAFTSGSRRTPVIAPSAADASGGWNRDAKPTTPTTATAASGSGRSMIPIIAGAVTVGLAALVVILVLGRGDDSVAAPATGGSAAIGSGSATGSTDGTTGTVGGKTGSGVGKSTAGTDSKSTAGTGTDGKSTAGTDGTSTAGADGKSTGTDGKSTAGTADKSTAAAGTTATDGKPGTGPIGGKTADGKNGDGKAGTTAGAGADGKTGKHDGSTKSDGKRDGATKTDGKSTGPITTPGGPVTTPGGPVTTPGGPVTTPTTIHSPTGSPLETTVDDDKPKPPPTPTPPAPAPAPTPAPATPPTPTPPTDPAVP